MANRGRTSESASLNTKKRLRSPSFEREQGWDSRINTASSMLPPYDPANDRHCLYTKSKKFKSLIQGKVNRSLSPSKERRKDDNVSTMQPMKSSALKKSYKVEGLSANSLRSVSTASGGATWQSDDTRDPMSELEVLKCIILRESYLSRLNEMSKNKNVLKNDLIDLIDLTRIVTIETIECIEKWRKSQTKSHPFIWNGINYLLKIPSDCDFLDKYIPLRSWLGFSSIRNPFIISTSLDDRRESPRYNYDNEATKLLSVIPTPITSSFVNMGGSKIEKGIDETSGNKVKRVSKTITPYEVPVINDPDLVKLIHSISSPKKDRKNSSSHTSNGDNNISDLKQEYVSQSSVSEVDLLRIRDCEKILLKEENITGVFTRDESGRIVPLKKLLNSYKHSNMPDASSFLPKMNNNATEALSIESRTPSASISENISVDPNTTFPREMLTSENLSEVQKKDEEKRLMVFNMNKDMGVLQQNENVKLIMEAKDPVGVQKAQKIGGILHPITLASSDGKKNYPKRQSKGARIDEAIRISKDEVKKLLAELEQNKKKLKQDQEALVALKIEEKNNPFVQEVDSDSKLTPISIKESEITERKIEIERSEAVLEKRMKDIQEKEEARVLYKQKYKDDEIERRKDDIARKLAQANNEVYEGESFQPLISLEDSAATEIQKIVRRRKAQKVVQLRRIAYNEAALEIQAGVRGWWGRKRARRKREERHAATQIQRVYRGFRDRYIVYLLKLDNKKKASIVVMQRVFRGWKGRKRFALRKELVRSGVTAYNNGEEVNMKLLYELSKIHEEDVPPPVITLLKCLIVLTARGRGAPEDLSWLKWRDISAYIMKKRIIGNIKKLGFNAKNVYTDLPESRIDFVRMYINDDPNMTVQYFTNIGTGSRVCVFLLEWMKNIINVQKLVKIFEPDNVLKAWLDDYIDDDDLSEVEIIEEDNLYVPNRVMRYNKVRNRPMLVLISRCVPTFSIGKITEAIMKEIPGTFISMDTPTLQSSNVQSVFDANQSLIAIVDAGVGAANRRKFLQEVDTIKKSIRVNGPPPMLVLLYGSVTNRHSGGTVESLGISLTMQKKMNDWKLKNLLENIYFALWELRPEQQKDILGGFSVLSTFSKPPSYLILLLEAFIIIITSTKTFRGPHTAVGSVTWESSLKLFSDLEMLYKRMKEVDVENISMDNLESLHLYFKHKHWPSSATMSSYAPCLILLHMWIENIIKFATLLAAEGGAPPRMSKKQGLFDSVVICKDGMEDGYEYLQGGKIGDGWKASYYNVLRPLLKDMKVFKTAAVISDVKMLVQVFRDCGKIYFSVYDQENTLSRCVSIPEHSVHALLKPNSVELKMNIQPPQNTDELYKRLVDLLRMERDRFTRRQEVVIKRKLRQLYIQGLRISSIYCTIIVSECYPGEIIVHAFDPRIQENYEIILAEDSIKMLIEDSEGKEKEAYLSTSSEIMVPFIVDRLRFRNEVLQVRKMGGGGRLIFQRGLCVSGIYVHVSLFLYDGATKVKIYIPNTSEEYVFNLSVRETVDLLGSLNPGNNSTLKKNLVNRLAFKTNKNNKRVCIINRVLFTTAWKVSHRLLVLEALCPINRDMGGVDFRVYAPNSSEQWLIKISDKDIKALVDKDLPLFTKTAQRQDIYRSLFPSMKVIQWKGGKNNLTGQRASSLLTLNVASDSSSNNKPLLCFPSYSRSTTLGKVTDEEDIPSLEKLTMPIPPYSKPVEEVDLMEVVVKKDRGRRNNDDEEEKMQPDLAKHVPMGHILEPEGKRLYRSVIAFEDKPYVVTIVYVGDLDQVFISCFDAGTCTAASVYLTTEDLRRVVASRIELLGSLEKTRMDMAEYVAKNRMTVMFGGPIGRCLGIHTMEGNFSITFDVDKVYNGVDKEHHLSLFPEDIVSNINNVSIPLYKFHNAICEGRDIFHCEKRINKQPYYVCLYEIDNGSSYRFTISNSFSTCDSPFASLHLTSSQVSNIISHIPSNRSEFLYRHLFNNSNTSYDDDDDEDLRSSNPIVREKAMRLLNKKRKDRMKDATNPRWLLRTDQRSALSVTLFTMLKLRKIKQSGAVILIIDPNNTYVNTDPVEVERLRNKNAKLKASALKKLIYRAGHSSKLGGFGIISLFEIEKEDSSLSPTLFVEMYLPKLASVVNITIPEYISTALLEQHHYLVKDSHILHCICQSIQLYKNDDDGFIIGGGVNLHHKIIPNRGENSDSSTSVEILQRFDLPLSFKHEQGSEIVNEFLSFNCNNNSFLLSVRIFYNPDNNSTTSNNIENESNSIIEESVCLFLMVCDLRTEKRYSSSLSHSQLLSLFSNDEDAKNNSLMKLNIQTTCISILSWYSFSKRKSENGDILEFVMDEEGFIRGGYKAKQGVIDLDRNNDKVDEDVKLILENFSVHEVEKYEREKEEEERKRKEALDAIKREEEEKEMERLREEKEFIDKQNQKNDEVVVSEEKDREIINEKDSKGEEGESKKDNKGEEGENKIEKVNLDTKDKEKGDQDLLENNKNEDEKKDDKQVEGKNEQEKGKEIITEIEKISGEENVNEKNTKEAEKEEEKEGDEEGKGDGENASKKKKGRDLKDYKKVTLSNGR